MARWHHIPTLFALIAFVCMTAPLRAGTGKTAALIEGKFEQIGPLLAQLRIPYDRIRLKQLETLTANAQYPVLFIPCGVGPSIEDAVTVQAHNMRLQGVVFSDEDYQINRALICSNFKTYIERGGAAYVSDLSYEYLECAFSAISFHDRFPNMGRAGTIEATFHDDLLAFTRLRYDSLRVHHSGWIAPRTVAQSIVLAEGEYPTPRGTRTGPIISLLPRGFGSIVFSSIHEDRLTDPFRFIAYRLYHRDKLLALVDEVENDGQSVVARIADRVLDGESVRSYQFNLASGPNTISIVSDPDRLTIDLWANGALIASHFPNSERIRFDITLDEPRTIRAQIYPSRGMRNVPFALVASSGRRKHPYVRNGLYGAGGIAVAAILILAIKALFFKKRFRGRIRK